MFYNCIFILQLSINNFRFFIFYFLLLSFDLVPPKLKSWLRHWYEVMKASYSTCCNYICRSFIDVVSDLFLSKVCLMVDFEAMALYFQPLGKEEIKSIITKLLRAATDITKLINISVHNAWKFF